MPRHRRISRQSRLERLETRSLLAAVAPPDGMVSWWAGDNTTADLLGRNDAALFNGGDYATGQVGDGFNFDGVDDNLQASTDGFPIGSADRTIELWVRIDQQVSNETFFASYGAPGVANQAYAIGATADARLYVSTWGTAVFGPALQNNRWYHVAATNVGTSFKLYLDGAEVGAGGMSVDTPAGSTFWLGRQTMTSLGDNKRLDGQIDEVSIYSRALSGGEIQAIYNAGRDGKVKSPAYFAANFPSVIEGPSDSTNVATFTIRRTGDPTGEATVHWATADGTAVAGSDYVAASGTVVFQAGESQRPIDIIVNGDNFEEANETFNLILTTSEAGYAVGAGLASILNDDVALSISDATTFVGDQIHSRGLFVEGLSGAHFNPISFGPDGNLYTAVGTGQGYNTVRRYDGTTGDFVDTFIAPGRINGVRDILFRDGYVFIGSEYTDEVLRFDATTGGFVDAFVTAGSGGIDGPHGLAFGPDANGDGVGELYVSGRNSQNVVRYDGATGQPIGIYVSSGSGGLSWPEGLTFDSSGASLFVASTGSSRILKYNAQTGAYVGVAASTNLSGPKDVKFGPDGLMYVASGGNDRIVRFTVAGAYVDDYVPAGTAGVDSPSRLAFFGADNDLFVTAVGNSKIFQFGTQSEAIFTVSLDGVRNLPVSVDFATADGTATAGSDYVAVSGTASFPLATMMRTVRVPLIDNGPYEGAEEFALNLSNPSPGAYVTDSQGVAIIPQPTKFYVVNDESLDSTFEYGTDGASIENYTAATGNSAPRGAASTIAGDKIWVVDANRKVYVYNTSGALQGTWTAGGLNASAQLQGITVFGADVWIVDAKTDKVYKYSGAANLLGGTQSATSSFALNKSNGNATDLVTDGTSFWVVDNATTDKVFKYSMNGGLQGSWTINGGGGSPTGITLDPADVSSLWIVDNASDTIYEFADAATNTLPSLAPSASFALAAGNTNPQGIADPPAATSADGAESDAASFDLALLLILEEESTSVKKRR